MTRTTRFTATGLDARGEDPASRLLGFLDCLLRGVGQVMFQNNAYAGLLFVVGVGYASPTHAAALVAGTAASTLAGMALGADRDQSRAGVYGFNGGLVGVALVAFLQPSPMTWACAILAAAFSTIVLSAMHRALDVWKMPALTAPFVLVALCVLSAAASFSRLGSSGLLPKPGFPTAAGPGGTVSVATLGEGLLNGLAQVFLQESVVAGALFAAGLLVASRTAFAAALAGSLAGLLVAVAMGAAEPAIRAGAYGFNGALTAIALAAVFLAPGRASFAYALAGAIVTPFAAAAAAAALAPLGLPALTAPFVIVTWTFVLASRGSARLRPAEGA